MKAEAVEATAEIILDSDEDAKVSKSVHTLTAQIVQHRFNGFSWDEIAHELRMTRGGLLKLRQREGIDALIADLAGEALETLAFHFMGMAPEAAKVLHRAIKGEEVPTGQAKAAQFAIQTVSKVGALAFEHRHGGNLPSRLEAVPAEKVLEFLRAGRGGSGKPEGG